MVKDDKEKTVFVLTDEYPPQGGGAGVVAASVVSGLSESVKTSLCFRKEKQSRLVFSFKAICCFVYYHLMQGQKLIVNDFFACCVVGLCDRIIPGVFFKNLSRVMLTHGSELELIDKHSRSGIKSVIVNKKNYEKCLSRSSNVIFPSVYLKGKFLASGLVSAEKNATVCYYGIDDFWFDRDCGGVGKDEESGSAAPEERDRTIRVITVARLVESKGFRDMLDALVEVTEEGVSIEWEIIGDGKFRSSFMDICAQKKSQNLNVVFSGALTREDIKRKLSVSDVFLLTPKNDEAFGLVFIEAQAQGIPCIGSRHSGIREAISEGSGELVGSKEEVVSSLIRFRHDKYNPDVIVKNANEFRSSHFVSYLKAFFFQSE